LAGIFVDNPFIGIGAGKTATCQKKNAQGCKSKKLSLFAIPRFSEKIKIYF
jgi:hypothetical protein